MCQNLIGVTGPNAKIIRYNTSRLIANPAQELWRSVELRSCARIATDAVDGGAKKRRALVNFS